MQRQFAISTPAQMVRTDADGRADVLYTVANTSTLPNRGLARVVPLGDTRAEWLALNGQSEREFPLDAIQQFTVSVRVPPEAPAGRYSLRLDVLSARKGGEEAYAGPVVTVDGGANAAPAKKSHWYVWVAAAVLILIAGVAGALMMRPKEEAILPATDTTPPTASVPTAPVPTATVPKDEPVVLAQVPDVTAMFVTDAIEWLQSSGFHADITADASAFAPRGTLIRQLPAAGTTGAHGSTVRLIVADTTGLDLSLSDDDQRKLGATTRDRLKAQLAKSVKMPEFANDRADFVDAVLALQRLGLDANLEFQPNHTMPLGKVYVQSSPAGTDLGAGDTVTLQIGTQGVGPYAVTVLRLGRLTKANQDLVQEFTARLEKHWREQQVRATEGKG